jgi:hypothetical protein
MAQKLVLYHKSYKSTKNTVERDIKKAIAQCKKKVAENDLEISRDPIATVQPSLLDDNELTITVRALVGRKSKSA